MLEVLVKVRVRVIAILLYLKYHIYQYLNNRDSEIGVSVRPSVCPSVCPSVKSVAKARSVRLGQKFEVKLVLSSPSAGNNCSPIGEIFFFFTTGSPLLSQKIEKNYFFILGDIMVRKCMKTCFNMFRVVFGEKIFF